MGTKRLLLSKTLCTGLHADLIDRECVLIWFSGFGSWGLVLILSLLSFLVGTIDSCKRFWPGGLC